MWTRQVHPVAKIKATHEVQVLLDTSCSQLPQILYCKISQSFVLDYRDEVLFRNIGAAAAPSNLYQIRVRKDTVASSNTVARVEAETIDERAVDAYFVQECGLDSLWHLNKGVLQVPLLNCGKEDFFHPSGQRLGRVEEANLLLEVNEDEEPSTAD